MAVPYIFGTATASIPLSNLDSNFATTITLGNTAIQLGNTVTTLNNMTLANVTIGSGSVTLTNIAVTTANLTTANIGTAVITGTSTLTGLTASTALALDASKNIVSVTNTGSGNNVLGTSPTIATPTINTITSAAGTALVLQSNNGNTAVTYDTSQNATFAGYVNAPNTFGFKNRIINGAMVIDQRNAGASQTFTAAAALAYAVDRWYGYCTGANVTGQQIAGGTTPTVTQNRYRFTGAASVTAVGFGQRIEQKNSYDLAGSTCTLSADLAISATLTTITWTAYYATTTADTFGSLASPTVTQIATGTFTVSATVTNFSANISVPAAATTGIQILFTVGALTAGLTWTIGNVQLEKGSTATSFDVRNYGTELLLCERYYQIIDGFAGIASSTTAVSAVSTFPVTMRTSPSVGTTAALRITDPGVADYTQSSGNVAIASGRVSSSGVQVSLGNFTTLVQRFGYQHNIGSNSITLSAEL